jgi:hypothetical protein
VTRLLRYVWASPWSLIGATVGLTFRSRRIRRGVLLCEGAGWPRRLGWRYRAITFGHVILCVDRIDDDTFEHEMVHVRQYESWGPLFVPVYLMASAWARIRGGQAYRDNRFEIAARTRMSVENEYEAVGTLT